jgi:hypothetical protein
MARLELRKSLIFKVAGNRVRTDDLLITVEAFRGE